MVRGVLGLHILLALFFMIGGWVHINYLGYEWWVFVAIGLWGLIDLLGFTNDIIWIPGSRYHFNVR